MTSTIPDDPTEERSRRAAGTPRVARVTAGVAAASVVLALIGLVVVTRTVRTPLQDCGVAAAYLLDGRVDQFANPDEPPTGLTRAEVLDNNTDPCRERAANQARPGLLLIAIGLVVGLVATFVEIMARWRWRRERRAAAVDAATPPGPDGPAPADHDPTGSARGGWSAPDEAVRTPTD